MSICLFEYAPYGLSQGTDATQSAEQVSQTSQVKIEKPKQFSDQYPSILWLDFCDPFIWPTEYAPGHCRPLISAGSNLLLGGIWHGFYAEEEDPIYDNINVEGYSGRPHYLQYPGNFRQNNRADLAIMNFPSSKIIFQSHVSTKTIPDDIFFDLFHLPGFVYENSWLDWPIQSSLIDRINHAKRTIPAFENFRRYSS